MTTLALALPSCPWIPERAASRERLHEALGLLDEQPEGIEIIWREFTEKAPNDVWSESVFTWLAEQDVDYCVQIQEDAEIPENFWKILVAILESLPPEADMLGAHVCSPLTPALVEEDVRLFSTADALVGVCWAVRGETMREFVEWRRTQLNDGWRTPVPPKGLPASRKTHAWRSSPWRRAGVSTTRSRPPWTTTRASLPCGVTTIMRTGARA